MGRSKPEKPTHLGPQLRELRLALGLSLRDIEAVSGLTSGYLSQVERSEVGHPSPTVLRKLAKGYDVAFPVLLTWAGYLDDEEVAITPNQAAALSTIGDPTADELKALEGIMNVLRRNQQSPSAQGAWGSRALDPVEQHEVDRYVHALLLEADALGRRPTPLSELESAAQLVRAGELVLSPEDKQDLRARFGKFFDLAFKRIKGALDFRSGSIWLSEGLHPMRERFVIGHEIGHAILPAHREFFTYVDNAASLAPNTRWAFEREANFASARLLFQCGQLNEEIDSSPLSLERICACAESFGASIVSTAREAAEHSRKEVAVAIAYKRSQFGPTNMHLSSEFNKRYQWSSGRHPEDLIRPLLLSATRIVDRVEWHVVDARGSDTLLRVESFNTGWAAIALIVRDPTFKRVVKKLVSPGYRATPQQKRLPDDARSGP